MRRSPRVRAAMLWPFGIPITSLPDGPFNEFICLGCENFSLTIWWCLRRFKLTVVDRAGDRTRPCR